TPTCPGVLYDSSRQGAYESSPAESTRGLGLKGSSPHLEHYLRLFHQGPIVTEISLVAGGTSAVCTCLVSVPSGEVAVTVTGVDPSVVWPDRAKITCPLASVRAAGGAGEVPSTTTWALGTTVPLA